MAEHPLSAAISALRDHRASSTMDMRAAFAADPNRFAEFSLELDDVLFDWSKCAVTGETMKLLEDLPASEKAKVIFIHFNHTNPLIRKNSKERREVLRKGFRIADEGMILDL